MKLFLIKYHQLTENYDETKFVERALTWKQTEHQKDPGEYFKQYDDNCPCLRRWRLTDIVLLHDYSKD